MRFRLLAMTIALLALVGPASAQFTLEAKPSRDRHAGYYYPKPSSEEVYVAHAETLAQASRNSRIGFVTAFTSRQLERPVSPEFVMFAKGAEAEKLIIVALEDGRIDTLYRARALFANLTAVARTTPIFQEYGVEELFTFFDFDGEEGNLSYVPQDPILLDQLKKDKKSGYLVFLPFKTKGFEGEIGVAMDKGGAITSIAVHKKAKGADLLNKSLSRFKGLGKKGQSQPFKIGGGKQMAKLAKAVFPVYLRAMETVTMYDREENERTWAD